MSSFDKDNLGNSHLSLVGYIEKTNQVMKTVEPYCDHKEISIIENNAKRLKILDEKLMIGGSIDVDSMNKDRRKFKKKDFVLSCCGHSVIRRL